MKNLPQLMSQLINEIDPLLAKLEKPDTPARAISPTDPHHCAWCSFSHWIRLCNLSKKLPDAGRVDRVQLFQCRRCHRYTVLRWQE